MSKSMFYGIVFIFEIFVAEIIFKK